MMMLHCCIAVIAPCCSWPLPFLLSNIQFDNKQQTTSSKQQTTLIQHSFQLQSLVWSGHGLNLAIIHLSHLHSVRSQFQCLGIDKNPSTKGASKIHIFQNIFQKINSNSNNNSNIVKRINNIQEAAF